MTEVKIVCTGRDQHKTVIFNQFTIDGDDVSLKRFRNANMADLAGLRDEDGAEAVSTVLLPADDPRLGDDAYRWDCPRCPVDLRISHQSLRVWLLALMAEGRHAGDISRHA